LNNFFETMKRNLNSLLMLLWMGCTTTLLAQPSSSLTVRYMVSFDESTKTFTAWVVPNYNTPNENNADSEEKGATAQFTLRVPKGFVLGNIRDIRGAWDKQPSRLSVNEAMIRAGATTQFDYFILGKAPAETNYGNFKEGEPVALFSFAGSGGNPAEVQVLEGNDPIIDITDRIFAFNIKNSFYSRSGQYRSMVALPGEQFMAPTVIKDVLAELAQKVNNGIASHKTDFEPEMQLIAYPNPVVSTIYVHYFSFKEKEKLAIELVDMEGDIRSTTNFVAAYGVNKVEIPVDFLITGVYLVRMKINDTVVNRKMLKINEGY
jgi:hypothetical protein